jgi:hypothetical protein
MYDPYDYLNLLRGFCLLYAFGYVICYIIWPECFED